MSTLIWTQYDGECVLIVTVLLYLLAVIFWSVFDYKRHEYNLYIYEKCSYADLSTVTIGAIVNLVLYTVDLLLVFKSR